MKPAQPLLFLLSLFFLLVGWEPLAIATPNTTTFSVRDRLPELAKAKFDEGSAFYKAGSYDDARTAFLRAYQMSMDPRVLYNVAVCEKSLGKLGLAINSLRTSVAKPLWASSGGEPPPNYSRLVDETIDKLSLHVGFVSIAVDAAEQPVDGWTLKVDGERAGAGVGVGPGAAALPLDVGTHTVIALKEGYTSQSQTITIAAPGVQREPVRFVLRPAPKGFLTIDCATRLHQQKPCDVTIDGVYAGQAPLTLERPAGEHIVRASIASVLFDESRIELEAGSRKEVVLQGARLESARLRVATEQATDTFTVDGKDAGRSGMSVELEPGEHHVIISRGPSGSGPEPSRTRTMEIVLRPNETRDLRLNFDEDGGRGADTRDTRDTRDKKISPWWFVGGGAAAIAITVVTIGVILATSTTTFEGSHAGTLNPYTVPASFGGGGR